MEISKTQNANRSSRRGLIVRELPRDERCAAAARQFIAEELGSEAGEVALSNALLVASELATNAYRHGRGRIELRVHRGEGNVRIEVVDGGADGEVQPRDSPGVTGGWGLRVVEQIALDWGSEGETTHVWADLPL